MSLVGGITGGVDTSDKMYFCYQCNRTVNIIISPSSDPFCPLCNDGFLEEYETPSLPNPRTNPNDSSFLPLSDPFSTLLPLLFSPSHNSNFIDSPNNPNFFGSSTGWNRQVHSDPFAFDPMVFLQSYLQNLRSNGTDVQFVIEGGGADHPMRLPGNVGDYFFGPGLEQLIQQLAENDPNRYGTPPASKSAVEKLPTVTVTGEITDSEMNSCAVCMDEFEKGAEAKQMPCKHIYHEGCLLPWLDMHNSCPVCRYELPTDDPDYESRTRDGGVAGGEAASRSFSISLTWPFGRQDGSGSGSPDGADMETREEELD